VKGTKILLYKFDSLHEDVGGKISPKIAYRLVVVSGSERSIGDRGGTPQEALEKFSDAFGKSGVGIVRRTHNRHPQVVIRTLPPTI
jgi:hypothetical protein